MCGRLIVYPPFYGAKDWRKLAVPVLRIGHTRGQQLAEAPTSGPKNQLSLIYLLQGVGKFPTFGTEIDLNPVNNFSVTENNFECIPSKQAVGRLYFSSRGDGIAHAIVSNSGSKSGY